MFFFRKSVAFILPLENRESEEETHVTVDADRNQVLHFGKHCTAMKAVLH